MDSGTKHTDLIITLARRLFNLFKNIRVRINRRMEGFKAVFMPLAGAGAVCAVLLVIMLFIPPYLGTAGDNSQALAKTMSDAGLAYSLSDTPAQPNAYFVKSYTVIPKSGSTASAHTVLIRCAIWLDRLITRDAGFDVRFLALLYSVLYIPAVLLLINQAAKRVLYFSEKVVVMLLGAVMFADVSYISYFNSLYPQPLWFILFLYIAGFALQISQQLEHSLSSLLFTASCSFFCLTRNQCALLGIPCAAFLLRRIPDFSGAGRRILLIIFASVILFSGLFSMLYLTDDFSTTDKLHSMTRGVLLQSADPEKTLSEFGIDPRYAVLADVSAFELYPFITGYEQSLEDGFLNRYDYPSIALYYLRHPFSMLAMLDLSVRASMNSALSFGGNFEASEGMPPGARSVFWSAASIFKARSAPKTIGFVILLAAAYTIMLGQRLTQRKNRDKTKTALLDTMVLITITGLLCALIVIVRSGDSQMLRQGFITGVAVDLLMYLSFAEILHRLNILESGSQTGKEG